MDLSRILSLVNQAIRSIWWIVRFRSVDSDCIIILHQFCFPSRFAHLKTLLHFEAGELEKPLSDDGE